MRLRILVLVILLLALSACNESEVVTDIEETVDPEVVVEDPVEEEIEVVLDVREILGKRQDSLVQLLGEPNEIVKETGVDNYVYEGFRIHVKGAYASSISYHDLEEFTYPNDNETVLKILGIDRFTQAEDMGVPFLHYRVSGLHQVSIFGNYDRPSSEYEGEDIPYNYVFISLD